MSKLAEVFKYIKENPTATNGEILENIEIGNQCLRNYLSRLKKKGYISKAGGTYSILEEFPEDIREYIRVSKSEFKTDIVLEMIDSYLDDFRESQNLTEKVRLGELIIRLLDKA